MQYEEEYNEVALAKALEQEERTIGHPF